MTDDILTGLAKLETYILDYGRLSGGQMRDKYGDDPMKGYDNVAHRFQQWSRSVRARAALSCHTAACKDSEQLSKSKEK